VVWWPITNQVARLAFGRAFGTFDRALNYRASRPAHRGWSGDEGTRNLAKPTGAVVATVDATQGFFLIVVFALLRKNPSSPLLYRLPISRLNWVGGHSA